MDGGGDADRFHALLTFGRWREILAEPIPPMHIPFRVAMVHHTGGVAHAAHAGNGLAGGATTSGRASWAHASRGCGRGLT